MVKKIELINQDELEARFKECLEQGRMPDYFLYLGLDGVQNWLKLNDSKGFPIASRLTDLLRQSLPWLVEYFPDDMSLVSVGVGRGDKEKILLKALLERGGGLIKYYAVDISSQMVDEALKTVADLKVDKTGLVAFLEDLPLLRQYWNPPILFCLLGNTFCNFDPDYILSIIYGQLEVNDLLLFDCHLLPQKPEGEESREVERVYRSPANRQFNTNPLVQRGVDTNNCVFSLELRSRQTDMGIVHRTNKWLQIMTDTTICAGQEKICLTSGETIHLGFTYAYTWPQVAGYLQRSGFCKLEHFLSAEGENLLVLACKRTGNNKLAEPQGGK